MDTVSRPPGLTLEPLLGIGARLRQLVRGHPDDRAWVRPAVLGLLAATAALYLWNLSGNGYANEYYAMAVQAGTQSWKAFFFGAVDAGSWITVDKPPASLWLMSLSARIFGLSSWSILVPEALLGVATVGLVYATVRRGFGPVAGLVAGVVMALTPVAVIMFRYNNPDALLTFLLTASGWALLRSIWTGRTRWLLVSAVLVGLAFNTKYLQGYIVLPALVLTYFLFAPGRLGRRVGRLLAAAGVLVVSTGWWTAIVQLIPAGARPYIGGSRTNSVLDVALGYDGLGRIFGQGIGIRPRGGGPSTNVASPFGGSPGLDRLFNAMNGGEVSWLLPLAAVAILVGLWAHRRSPRTDLARASYVLWGLWLATHFMVFSYAAGIFHSYYTVAMAPAVAALVGSAATDVWRRRVAWPGYRVVAAAALLATAWWGYQLLARTPNWMPALRTVELALAIVASVLLLVPFARLSRLRGLVGRLRTTALAAGLAAVMLGPAAYAIDNVGRSVGGAIPVSGPATAALPGGRYQFISLGPNGDKSVTGGPPPKGAEPPNGAVPRMGGPAPDGASSGAPRGDGGAPGGGLDSSTISYLVAHQGGATWLVAVSSTAQAAPVQLSTRRPVLAMGGFGGDPAMTVDKLVELVKAGKLRYVYVGGGPTGGPSGGPSGSGEVTIGPSGADNQSAVIKWVQQHGTPVRDAGSGSGTLYDLTSAASR